MGKAGQADLFRGCVPLRFAFNDSRVSLVVRVYEGTLHIPGTESMLSSSWLTHIFIPNRRYHQFFGTAAAICFHNVSGSVSLSAFCPEYRNCSGQLPKFGGAQEGSLEEMASRNTSSAFQITGENTRQDTWASARTACQAHRNGCRSISRAPGGSKMAKASQATGIELGLALRTFILWGCFVKKLYQLLFIRFDRRQIWLTTGETEFTE